jgi:hypothetical protein
MLKLLGTSFPTPTVGRSEIIGTVRIARRDKVSGLENMPRRCDRERIMIVDDPNGDCYPPQPSVS